MTFAYVTMTLSPHQLPLCRSLAGMLAAGSFKCFIVQGLSDDRRLLGWSEQQIPEWVVLPTDDKTEALRQREWMSNATVLLTWHRDFDLMRARVQAHRLTLYASERWFKPPWGIWRVLHPRMVKHVRQVRRLSKSTCYYYLAAGFWAYRDMKMIVNRGNRIRKWGYFIETQLKPSVSQLSEDDSSDNRCAVASAIRRPQGGAYADGFADCGIARKIGVPSTHALRVLWVGRMLALKRVDTLIRAVGNLLNDGRDLQLLLVGQGPEEKRLKEMGAQVNRNHEASKGAANRQRTADSSPPITFKPSVPISQVRALMRQSDVYVFPSSGVEGWGVVVNEALAEGCCVIASRESGASSFLIRHGSTGFQFSSGSVFQLTDCLRQVHDNPSLRVRVATAGHALLASQWDPDVAARRLLMGCEEWHRSGDIPIAEEGPLSLCDMARDI